MSKDTGKDFRRGSVDNRTQFHNKATDMWMKRDTKTGQFMSGTDHPYKGVAKETDHRRTK